jgi:hypothetical protein
MMPNALSADSEQLRRGEHGVMLILNLIQDDSASTRRWTLNQVQGDVALTIRGLLSRFALSALIYYNIFTGPFGIRASL